MAGVQEAAPEQVGRGAGGAAEGGAARPQLDDFGASQVLLEARRGHIRARRGGALGDAGVAARGARAQPQPRARAEVDLAERKGWARRRRRRCSRRAPRRPPAARGVGADERGDGADLKGETLQWFKIFNVIDEDGSGLIQYAEFLRLTRTVLKVTEWELPLRKLQSVWCGMDGSGRVTRGEFGKFAHGREVGAADQVRERARASAFDLGLSDPEGDRRLAIKETENKAARLVEDQGARAHAAEAPREARVTAGHADLDGTPAPGRDPCALGASRSMGASRGSRRSKK